MSRALNDRNLCIALHFPLIRHNYLIHFLFFACTCSLEQGLFFTCGPGLRTGSVQWLNSDNLLFSKKITSPSTKSENICLTELGIKTKSVENMIWKICNPIQSKKNTTFVETNAYKIFFFNKDSQLESVKIGECLKPRDWKVSDIAQTVLGTGKQRIQKRDLSLGYHWENVVMSLLI